MKRRELLGILAGWPAMSHRQAAPAPRGLAFPADFGAHPANRIEWWYLTGELAAGARRFGFQLTFFRSRTGVAASASRFSPDQLVFAHAAVSDLQAGRLRHDQRIARAGFGIAQAAEGDTAVRLRDWSLQRSGPVERSRYDAHLHSDSAALALTLRLEATSPPLLQGQSGYSRKSGRPGIATFYYSQPQLTARGQLTLDGQALDVQGRAWLDHEWSDALLDPDAVGWDWMGINLDDGGALTAFRLRRGDGSPLYAGGSLQSASTLRDFKPDEVSFTPGRIWQSPSSQGRYPVTWTVHTPAGRHQVVALLDAQELDSRASTGTFYWEGLSELRDDTGRRLGRGYLEMTGYAGRLRL